MKAGMCSLLVRGGLVDGPGHIARGLFESKPEAESFEFENNY